ncbi:MAG: patatin-like phospholipase family protein [Caldisericaceae bacterium]
MKIGLALGSGGPRGLAHIGVLKTLINNGIEPDIIAGTSIGALVGGAYSVFGSLDEVEELAYSSDMRTVISVLFDPTLRLGIIKGQKVVKFLREKIGNPLIEDLEKEFCSVATNINTGESFVFDRGELVTAIRASISIPFMFQPVKVGDMLLVDGGLTENVPAKILRQKGASLVIAVNLNAKLSNSFYGSMKSPVGLYKIADESINILQYNLAKENCKHADIVIAPDVYGAGWDSFWKPQEVIEAGEKATQAMIGDIKSKLKRGQFLRKII